MVIGIHTQNVAILGGTMSFADIKPILIYAGILVGLWLVRKIAKNLLPMLKMMGFKPWK
jgi:hypothetical protein